MDLQNQENGTERMSKSSFLLSDDIVNIIFLAFNSDQTNYVSNRVKGIKNVWSSKFLWDSFENLHTHRYGASDIKDPFTDEEPLL